MNKKKYNQLFYQEQIWLEDYEDISTEKETSTKAEKKIGANEKAEE
ncbi:MAG: hypothetical protein H6599_00985 [Flavobacteriales bacterium]|nr:hypothetical protein [Flavobacteriales bacterium]